MFDIQTNVQIKKGNPAAFKDVFRMLYPRLKGYCKLFVSDDNKVEDLIQETFITLWEKRNSIKTEHSIESFLFVILRNNCLNFLRNEKMEKTTFSIDVEEVSELQYLYQIDFLGKEEKSLEEQLIESFQEAVDELPDKMKQVFTLCKIEGRKQKEVAEEIGISLKMVEKHIAKAKEQIRKKLMNQYPMLIIIITLLLD
ncbi:RNA polymerase sigma factor [Draconibacterium halophilum]|uniref:RNA polymerase sigma-70 factor n=1 Tax=Draconibacterium halophilum TaxID=2706887 RepID=A0A6C0RFJ0_9BACT|nr:RNA polymerase sigma-70 factor [Draconibacterium halophilum]QIA08602.1 RNA polymerase sigma-70 factor [Draconibacterium halophilum]